MSGTSKAKHPIQPLVWDKQGVIRFKENKLVTILLDAYPGMLNSLVVIAEEQKLKEDYVQLMQLIGYSVSGASDLSCMPIPLMNKARAEASRMAHARQRKKI